MKKLLLLSIIFLSQIVTSQENVLFVFSKTNNTEVLTELSPFSEKLIIDKTYKVYPIEYIKTYDILGNTEYLRSYTEKGVIYIGINNIDISHNEIKKIKSKSTNTDLHLIQSLIDNDKHERIDKEIKLKEIEKEKENERIKAEKEKEELEIKQKEEALKKILEEYDKKGLVITNKEYSYSYGGFFGLDLQFYNGYNKTIKYIDLTIRPYNRVGDLTHDEIGRDVMRLQLIGPAEPKTIFSNNFDELFYDDNNIIHTLVITYIKITFTDNTTKKITDINNHLGINVYNGKGE